MLERITIDPKICHGKPVIKNTRVLVSNILADLASGQSYEEIIENYPNISNEDIKSALVFSSKLATFESFPYEASA